MQWIITIKPYPIIVSQPNINVYVLQICPCGTKIKVKIKLYYKRVTIKNHVYIEIEQVKIEPGREQAEIFNNHCDQNMVKKSPGGGRWLVNTYALSELRLVSFHILLACRQSALATSGSADANAHFHSLPLQANYGRTLVVKANSFERWIQSDSLLNIFNH